jgi:hypothetical protein
MLYRLGRGRKGAAASLRRFLSVIGQVTISAVGSVEFSIQSLAVEHREIEAALDLVAAGIATGAIDRDAVRRVWTLCISHFGREDEFLVRLAVRDAALAAKLRGQHDETLEIAARLEETMNAGQERDAIYLARRLLAITQHNIIEEERDVFPVCGGGEA